MESLIALTGELTAFAIALVVIMFGFGVAFQGIVVHLPEKGDSHTNQDVRPPPCDRQSACDDRDAAMSGALHVPWCKCVRHMRVLIPVLRLGRHGGTLSLRYSVSYSSKRTRKSVAGSSCLQCSYI